ncbi:MAG: tRNA pseudouridine(38-40) synthase TruA [Methanospirillaceae archaeon]|nr:tRNA pseudouridine(38-40) synthase TruA [Methanospirillaceae archaeon]
MEPDKTKNLPVRIAFLVSYLGSGFHGSQVQPRVRTVEGDILRICYKTNLFKDDGSGRFRMAGRTDRGVSARRQIFAFTTCYPQRAILVLQKLLPPDIYLSAYAVVDDRFNPRYVPVSRTYRYYSLSPIPDPGYVNEVASLFIGSHAFHCFAKMEPGRDPVRHVYASSLVTETGRWYYEIQAESFLWNMVRGIVTALLWCSQGKISKNDVHNMLSGTCPARIPPADPTGLVLWDIECQLAWIPLLPVLKKEEKRRALHMHHQLISLLCEEIFPDT